MQAVRLLYLPMPSGRTHDRITLWLLPLVGGLTAIATRSSTITLLMGAGYLFGGLMLGPDLDIHSIHYKRWGWFRWIWIPYRGSMRHRSPLSHAPITGTVIRLLYLAIWVVGASLVGIALVNEVGQMGWTWDELAVWGGRSLRRYYAEWLTVLAGLELGALSHYAADWGLTMGKRWRKYGWQALTLPPFWAKSKPRRSPRKGGDRPQRRSRRQSDQ